MSYRIPFNKPFMVGKELYYVAQSVLSGNTAGDGEYSRKCVGLLSAQTGAAHLFLTPSCTAALELAAILSGIGEGDEVILPSYTFVSTANAFHLRGATLKFVDIRCDTLNLDESLVAEAISERTKAIVPVHYAGVGCEMDRIMKLAAEKGVQVIEDAAQGLNAKYRGRHLGTFGDFGAYSFHETKNFICGEGGALVVKADDQFMRAEIIRNKGTNRSAFFRGQTDHYEWLEVGSSYVPSDMLAAFLYAQLEVMEQITERRRRTYDAYFERLAPLEEKGFLNRPTIPEWCETNYHMFYVLLENESTRAALIEHLQSRGILAVFHYVSLHTSPVGKSMGYREGMLPVTEEISPRLLRLPMYYDLTEEDIECVVAAIFEFFDVKFEMRRC